MSNENEFFIAVSKRQAEMNSAKNKQLVMQCATMLAMSANTNFLQSLQVKASDFVEQKNANEKMCVYSVQQIVHVLTAITKVKERASLYDASENVVCALRTAINFLNAKRKLTKADILSALDLDIKIADDKQALIYRRRTHFDSAKRQTDICMNVLRVLKIISQDNRVEYSVNNNAVTKALAKMLSK